MFMPAGMLTASSNETARQMVWKTRGISYPSSNYTPHLLSPFNDVLAQKPKGFWQIGFVLGGGLAAQALGSIPDIITTGGLSPVRIRAAKPISQTPLGDLGVSLGKVVPKTACWPVNLSIASNPTQPSSSPGVEMAGHKTKARCHTCR